MTTRVGIIGWPLTYTLSPVIHNAAFTALGMDWFYDAMAIPPDIVRLGLREPADHGYVGVNVTIPHKEAVLRYVMPDDTAHAIGAVNTVDLRDYKGYNTDVSGFIDDLRAHDIALDGVHVVVLGAGGAARAAVYGLGRAGARVSVVNRTRERADTMLANLSIHLPKLDARAVSFEDVARDTIDLLVNCTPSGMYPNVNDSAWDESVPFPHEVTVYDMIYRPSKTRLMQQAESHGGRAINGLGMLVRQAAAAFTLWTGVNPPLDVMFDAARAELQRVESQT